MEELPKYYGKTLKFKAFIGVDKSLPKGTFLAGRHVMTCCAEDVQFAGLLCVWKKAGALTTGLCATVTAQIQIDQKKSY